MHTCTNECATYNDPDASTRKSAPKNWQRKARTRKCAPRTSTHPKIHAYSHTLPERTDRGDAVDVHTCEPPVEALRAEVACPPRRRKRPDCRIRRCDLCGCSGRSGGHTRDVWRRPFDAGIQRLKEQLQKRTQLRHMVWGGVARCVSRRSAVGHGVAGAAWRHVLVFQFCLSGAWRRMCGGRLHFFCEAHAACTCAFALLRVPPPCALCKPHHALHVTPTMRSV
eukprot:353123-Chlamydomonas_euryale.AAC.3